jgi:hypothetical protein
LGYRPGSIEVVDEETNGAVLREILDDFSIKISGKEITANQSRMAQLVNKELSAD